MAMDTYGSPQEVQPFSTVSWEPFRKGLEITTLHKLINCEISVISSKTFVIASEVSVINPGLATCQIMEALGPLALSACLQSIEENTTSTRCKGQDASCKELLQAYWRACTHTHTHAHLCNLFQFLNLIPLYTEGALNQNISLLLDTYVLGKFLLLNLMI